MRVRREAHEDGEWTQQLRIWVSRKLRSGTTAVQGKPLNISRQLAALSSQLASCGQLSAVRTQVPSRQPTAVGDQRLRVHSAITPELGGARSSRRSADCPCRALRSRTRGT